jgi:hypothetical protein
MGMNDFIADSLCLHIVEDSTTKLSQMEPNQVFFIRGLWTGWNVDNPGAGAQRDDSVNLRILVPGKHIDIDSLTSKLPRYLSDIDVHATCFLPTQRSQGAGVNTDHGNPLQFGFSSRL